MMQSVRLLACFFVGMVPLSSAFAKDGRHFWSGDWSVAVGSSVAHGPAFTGSRDDKYLFSPIISVGRQGETSRFSSRNDSAGFTLYENGPIRAGIAGKLITGRDAGTSKDLKGLSEVRFGGEIGGFIDIYPTDNLRARAEIRHGIRSHNGTVVDLAMDAFTDLTPEIRLSGGPRASYGTAGFSRAYYDVNTDEAAASGLSTYSASSGWQTVGVGGAITWKATRNIDASLFAEYNRMVGVASDSSLVQQKGSQNQVLIGLSATYRFDFSLD